MEGDVRHASDSLNLAEQSARLAVDRWLSERSDRPWQSDFFALMRRLEAMLADEPRWGHAPRPSMEAVRVGQAVSLSFAPASVTALAPSSDARPARVSQAFFTHVGPNGPLPMHLSELVRERSLNQGDPTLEAFLNVLLHRFALQFYRAWAQARPVTGMDRPERDAFRHQVGAFIGMAGVARQQRDAVHDDARLHFSGWLARRVHSAEGLASVIAAYFGVAVRVERWAGHWMPLPIADQSRLGGRARQASACLLGRGAVLGSRVWDRQHKVRLHLGPLTLAQYQSFLPDGDARAALLNWLQQLLGDECEWEVQPSLAPEQVPPSHLGQVRGRDAAPRLGWVSWLGGARIGQPVMGARLSPAQAKPSVCTAAFKTKPGLHGSPVSPAPFHRGEP